MSQILLNGRSTRAEVERICELVKKGAEGSVFSHESLATLADAAVRSSRYRTVINAARRRLLRENGIELISVPGVGYRYPRGFEQVASGVGKIHRGVRSIGRGIKVAGMVSDKRLPDDGERAARNHIVGQGRYLYEMARTERKKLQIIVGTPEAAPRLPMRGEVDDGQ